MSQEFTPNNRSANKGQQLERFPDPFAAQVIDAKLNSAILSQLQLEKSEEVNLSTESLPKIKFQPLRAASHLRLRLTERALERVEKDISCLNRAYGLPHLIKQLKPTLAQEVFSAFPKIVQPLVVGASFSATAVIFSGMSKGNQIIELLCGCTVFLSAATGIGSTIARAKKEFKEYSNSLSPSRRTRQFLVGLQSEHADPSSQRVKIGKMIDKLVDRSFKLVRAREQAEEQLLWQK